MGEFIYFILIISSYSSDVLETEPLCQIMGCGVFPTLEIIDARSGGCGKSISKKQVWTLFNLDKLNKSLNCDPQQAELMYNRATRQSYRKKPPVYTRSIVDFNFSAAPLYSTAFEVTLALENNGVVPCDWEFLYPTDLQMELEYWAESGEFSEEEMQEVIFNFNSLDNFVN